MYPAAILIAVLLLLAGCSGSTGDSATAAARHHDGGPLPGGGPYTGPALAGLTTEDWDVTVISDTLNYPWDLRMAGDTIVVTEIDGTITTPRDDTETRTRVATSQPVVHDGGSGLLGLELAPDVNRSGQAWIYYTYNGRSGLTNRIAAVRYDGTTWTEQRVLVDDIPGHQLYNGGRIALGPDGALYATTGWSGDDAAAQDPRSLAGKILRMDPEGRPLPDNPDPGSLVYSLGHRNPQGLAWNSRGEMYSAEHGETAQDEINRIVPGGNYGWPDARGDDRAPGMTPPLAHSGSRTWAPSGIAFAGDDLVLAALRSEDLTVLAGPDRAVGPVFSTGERARAVLPTGDGVYMTTTNTSPRAAAGSGGPDRLLWLRPRS